MIGRRLLALAVLMLAAPAAAGAQAISIADVRVQVFYDRSGTWSVDLTKEKDLGLFNLVIGGGDLKEPATDVLVALVLKGPKDTFEDKTGVSITVFDDEKKRKIAERNLKGILFGAEGVVVKPVFLAERTCTPLRIVAKAGSATKTVTVPFRCGE